MTIDEAISEFKERVEDSKKISELGMKSYIPKAKEEEQLAEWLEELKELRNMTAGHLYAVAFNRGYLKAEKEVRNKAIDDFVNQFNVIVDEKCGTDTNNYFRKIVKEIAEQLKEREAK